MFIKLLAACAMPHIPKKTLIAHLTMGIGKRRRALAPYMQPLKEVNWAEVDREPPSVLDGGILRPADRLVRIDYRMGMGKMMGGVWDLSIIIF